VDDGINWCPGQARKSWWRQELALPRTRDSLTGTASVKCSGRHLLLDSSRTAGMVVLCGQDVGYVATSFEGGEGKRDYTA